MFKKTYILPNGYENLEMEVAVDVTANTNIEKSFFYFLCAIVITDKDNSDNVFTYYGDSFFSTSELYRVIMAPDKNRLFTPYHLSLFIAPERDRWKPFGIPECLKNLFIFPSDNLEYISETDAFAQCLSRVSKDINSYYQTRFFENNSYLSRKSDDMTYIFDACKDLNSFK